MADEQKLRILVVDDEPAMCRSLERLLRTICDVRACASGEEALGYLAVNPVDIILSDYSMPNMDGKRFLLQAMVRDSRPYRVLMSGGHSHLAQVALADGVVHLCLEKPLGRDSLSLLLPKAREHLTVRDNLAAIK